MCAQLGTAREKRKKERENERTSKKRELGILVASKDRSKLSIYLSTYLHDVKHQDGLPTTAGEQVDRLTDRPIRLTVERASATSRQT